VPIRRTPLMSALQVLFMAAVVAVAATTSGFGSQNALAGVVGPSVTPPELSARTQPSTTLTSAEPSRPPTTQPTPAPSTAPATSAPTTRAPQGSWANDIGTPGTNFLGVSTATDSAEEIQLFADAAGRMPDVVMLSRDWASGGFDLVAMERLWAAGHVPMVAWEPWDHTSRGGGRLRSVQPEYALSTIIDGKHDEYLRQWAADAAAWGHPLILRFAHEMNGYWYPWAELANNNTSGEFIDAWRHVHEIFAAAGANNVIWVWSPNLDSATLQPIDSLWPGDEYVDWVGLVGYLGNGIDPRVWTPSFDELFGPTLDEVRVFTEQPIVITEIGATELGGQKANWIADVLSSINSRPDIIGLVWFEIDKESDWRIVTSTEATAAFAAGVAGPAWGFRPDVTP
jgi:mannan endo-1,4-beta-mannosidase